MLEGNNTEIQLGFYDTTELSHHTQHTITTFDDLSMEFAFCLSLTAIVFNGVEQGDVTKMDTGHQWQKMYCGIEHIYEINKFIKVLVKCELK